ncbi:MAG: thymidine kinase [Pseudomonadota bacterium]
MAKLYFYYSAMNAGKSTMLLQSAYNYNERGMDTIIFVSAIDHRFGSNKVSSRIGLSANAVSFDNTFNLYDYVNNAKNTNAKLSCILVDEAQFLSKEQVIQLTDIVDRLNLPVLAFGIRSDFQGEPFPGSLSLLVLADNIVELKTICFCGKKAIMNTRIDAKGKVVRKGEQIAIGGNENYISTCRKHFKELESVPVIE